MKYNHIYKNHKTRLVPYVCVISTHDVKSQQCIYFTLRYRIIALFGACCAYSRKTTF